MQTMKPSRAKNFYILILCTLFFSFITEQTAEGADTDKIESKKLRSFAEWIVTYKKPLPYPATRIYELPPVAQVQKTLNSATAEDQTEFMRVLAVLYDRTFSSASLATTIIDGIDKEWKDRLALYALKKSHGDHLGARGLDEGDIPSSSWGLQLLMLNFSHLTKFERERLIESVRDSRDWETKRHWQRIILENPDNYNILAKTLDVVEPKWQAFFPLRDTSVPLAHQMDTQVLEPLFKIPKIGPKFKQAFLKRFPDFLVQLNRPKSSAINTYGTSQFPAIVDEDITKRWDAQKAFVHQLGVMPVLDRVHVPRFLAKAIFKGKIKGRTMDKRFKPQVSNEIFFGVPTRVTINQKTGDYVAEARAIGQSDSAHDINEYLFRPLYEFLSGTSEPKGIPNSFTVEEITLIPTNDSGLTEVSFRPGKALSAKTKATFISYQDHIRTALDLKERNFAEWRAEDRRKADRASSDAYYSPGPKARPDCELLLAGFGGGRGLSGDPGWWERWMKKPELPPRRKSR